MVILFLTVFLAPRLINIRQFTATDEGAWLYRSGDFLYALGQREFLQTFVSYHPGVVTSWGGSVALLIEFPDYYKLGQGYFSEYEPYEEFLEANGVSPYDVMVTGRLILIGFSAVLMTISLLIFIELVGIVPSGIAFTLLAIDPFFIALTRMFHLDAPMAVLILVSLSSFLAYLRFPKRRWLWLALSGFFGGVAVLAKLPSAILAPVIVILLGIEEFNNKNGNARQVEQRIWDVILRLALWGGAAVAALILFWPAMWVQPIKIMQSLLVAATGTTTGSVQTFDVYVEPTIFFFYNPLHQSWMNYLASFLWRTTPVILFGLIILVVGWLSKLGMWGKGQVRKYTRALLTFAAIYLVLMTVGAKQSQKYLLPAYLVIVIAAGLGFASLPSLLQKFWTGKWVESVGTAVIVAGFVVQILLVFPHLPYYWTYYNPLLGGSERAGRTIFVGTGEGLDLAGKYLNSKPDADQLVAMSWYGTGCLSYFFDGEVISISSDNTWDEDERARLAESDYLLIYSNQLFRDRPSELLDDLEGISPEKEIWLNGIEFVRIYDVDDLPDEIKK
jgi:hypothetical protein